MSKQALFKYKNKLRQFLLFRNTVKWLSLNQIFYQVYYRIWPKKIRSFDHPPAPHLLDFVSKVHSNSVFRNGTEITFLNVSKNFSDIDWNYSELGKLWTYNLNYFDFLNNHGCSKYEGLNLIHDFCSKSNLKNIGSEPYPTSLRIVNWVKFLSRFKVKDERVNSQLFRDLLALQDRIEYHIMGNHLFENGFGLLFGSYYFQDDNLYQSSTRIIRSQLKEQILSDGAHFELSPMYHNIILLRILDTYQLVSKNNWKANELSPELKYTAQLMLGWMNGMTFSNGEMPCVNDSTQGIAPSCEELNELAEFLEIEPIHSDLGLSGYRKYFSNGFELFFDCGQIAPSYQPGHSHADSLQIILSLNGIPYIVDTGVSTYEKNSRRQEERSTSSHNSITIDNINSSEIWGGFRVGIRAEVAILKESQNAITAQHNGYRKLKITHQRKIEISAEGYKISDLVIGRIGKRKIQGHLHFHPDRNVVLKDGCIFIDNQIQLKFDKIEDLEVVEYQFAQGFNQLCAAKKIVYTFNRVCDFEILKTT